jgi:hypothetical protein
LDRCSEANLRNPLRQFRTVGSVRGERGNPLVYSEAILLGGARGHVRTIFGMA